MNVIDQIVRITVDGDETKAEVIGEIVRCEQCWWWDGLNCKNNDSFPWDEDDYCSQGRRKDGDGDELVE